MSSTGLAALKWFQFTFGVCKHPLRDLVDLLLFYCMQVAKPLMKPQWLVVQANVNLCAQSLIRAINCSAIIVEYELKMRCIIKCKFRQPVRLVSQHSCPGQYQPSQIATTLQVLDHHCSCHQVVFVLHTISNLLHKLQRCLSSKKPLLL